MKLREFIATLLDCDMDAEVEIRIETEENTDSISEFELLEEGYTNQKYLSFEVKPLNQVLVNEKDYESLKEEKEQLDSLVEELKENIQTLNEEIEKLESGE